MLSILPVGSIPPRRKLGHRSCHPYIPFWINHPAFFVGDGSSTSGNLRLALLLHIVLSPREELPPIFIPSSKADPSSQIEITLFVDSSLTNACMDFGVICHGYSSGIP
ncbi:hypothetical protein PNOK_0693500 [Pyrrhoderma noxium]|uniref:Uncharacterized protein n=1 Tax=Pyrrhoderma noxium TaxID=2282107 RepID=A0A286UBA1_9AGAM|nr:hypothetical protein PNOK_0693500 [Pyrrhoderma noxium]